MSNDSLTHQPWVCMSSSSGVTFEKTWSLLSPAAKDSFQGFFCDSECGSLEWAKKHLDPEKVFYFPRKEFELAFLNWSQKHQVGVVFLCGFFKILSAEFLEDCSSVFVNTHPSLLPAFPGLEKKVHREVFESVCLSGFSVHLVNASLDGGPIIFQHPVSIIGSEDVDESRARVRASEQRLLAPVLESVLKSQLKSEDRNLSTKKLHEKYNLGMTSFKEC